MRTIKKKIQQKGRYKLFKYEQTYYIKKMIVACDKLASMITRFHYCGNGKADCVTKGISVCKGPITYKTSQCCHTISRKFYSIRRDLRQLYAGCASCNCYGLQEHDNAITARFLKEHGEEVRNELREKRSMKKPTYEEIEKTHEQLRIKALSMGLISERRQKE